MNFIRTEYTEEEKSELEDILFDVLGDYVPLKYVQVISFYGKPGVYVQFNLPKDISKQLFADFNEKISETKFSNLNLAILC